MFFWTEGVAEGRKGNYTMKQAQSSLEPHLCMIVLIIFSSHISGFEQLNFVLSLFTMPTSNGSTCSLRARIREWNFLFVYMLLIMYLVAHDYLDFIYILKYFTHEYLSIIDSMF